ncbi:MAG: hypothetical protein KJO07_01535 [Deltaproteobacteria bacterium]|nr:hypothetical protein [Deltaproteobacteria bacterium]
MCLICVEFQKQRMSAAEARRALGEMRIKVGDEHAKQVERMLEDAAKDKK